jgi:ABC-type Fe3+-hydroxamate transport system substrate-binding protein
MPALVALSSALLLVAGCGGESQPGGEATGATTTDAVATESAAVDGPWSKPLEPVAFPLTFTDGAGKEHTIDAPYTKVGCLYAGCDEDLADLGLVPNATLSGGDDGPFLRPAGQPAFEIQDEVNPEEWAKTGSDVIIDLAGPIGDDDERALKSVAPVVFLNSPYRVWNPDRVIPGIQAWKEDLWLIGQITDHADLAKAAIERFDDFMSGLKAMAPEDAASTQIANLSADDPGVYSLLDPKSPFCDALSSYQLGSCISIAGWNANSWAVNSEAFLAADPQWIAYTVYDPEQSYTDRKDPVWQRLTAVKEGRVFDFSRSNCCSLRLLEHALQDYAFHVWGPDSGVPDPGPENDYVPSDSPVLGSTS